MRSADRYLVFSRGWGVTLEDPVGESAVLSRDLRLMAAPLDGGNLLALCQDRLRLQTVARVHTGAILIPYLTTTAG